MYTASTRSACLGLDQHAEAVGIRRRGGIIDDHSEFRSSLNGKGGEFQVEQACIRVLDALHALAVRDHIIVLPERFEFRACPAFGFKKS